MKNYRKILFFLMLSAFLLLATTGIIKFPEFRRFTSFVFLYIPASTVSLIHDFSGITLVVLISIHLVFNVPLLFSRKDKKIN